MTARVVGRGNCKRCGLVIVAASLATILRATPANYDGHYSTSATGAGTAKDSTRIAFDRKADASNTDLVEVWQTSCKQYGTASTNSRGKNWGKNPADTPGEPSASHPAGVTTVASSSKRAAKSLGAFTATSLEYELGKELGLTSGGEVPTSVVQSTIQGADQGNRDSLYFLGLLKLYGISVTPDAAMAVDLIRKAAEMRHPEAMAALGVMLVNGRGGSRDYGAAVAWFKMATAAGHVDAMWLLGRMYYEGKGVDGVDFAEAQKWFYRAAAEGTAKGQYYMGVLHEYGLGVLKDQHRAVEWHSMAAEQGLAESEYHLGLMKAHGRGFSQDFSGAAIHFQKGARRHHAPSMMYLGRMFLYGHGFPVDYDMAFLWFQKAAEEGVPLVSTDACAARDELRYSLLEARVVNDQLASQYDYGKPLADGNDHPIPLRYGLKEEDSDVHHAENMRSFAQET